MNVTISDLTTVTPKIFWQTNAAYGIGVYGMFVIGIIGLIANVLAYIVFGRLNNQSGSMTYLQMLAVSDLISLSWDTVVSTALPFLGISLEGSSMWACKLGIWHNMASSTAASCALLVVAADRFVFLNFSGFHKAHCTRKIAVLVSIGLWVFTYAYCSPLIYFYELSGSAGCVLSSDPVKLNAGLKFVTFVTYGPYFSIPVFGIIVSNVSIVKLLWQRKKNRQKMNKTDKEADEVSWLLIIDCVAFLVIIGIVAALWALAWNPPVDEEEKAKFQLMFVLAQFLSCVEESVDFFLYASFSKSFRKALFLLFGVKGPAVATVQVATIQAKSEPQNFFTPKRNSLRQEAISSTHIID